MKIQKIIACQTCHSKFLKDYNFAHIAQIHIKLYIFGELSIWNWRIRRLNCVLEFYKKVKKSFMKIFSLENGIFFKNENQYFQFFDTFVVLDLHENFMKSWQIST